MTGTARTIPLDDPTVLTVHDVTVLAGAFDGRPCLTVTSVRAHDEAWMADPHGSGGGIAVLPDVDFHDGTIEVDVASAPKQGASPDARGFAGLAFRVTDDGNEHVYLRPTNGRSDNQFRRNHSVQYASTPDFEWDVLRRDFPSAYETYADVQPNRWMHLRREVSGVELRVFVNGAEQPTLLVHDLKHGDVRGGTALWIGVEAEAHFSNLVVTAED